MKRLLIALLLLVFIIIILCVGNFYIADAVKKLEDLAQKCHACFENKSYTQASNYADDLEKLWIEKEDKLSVFVNDATIEEIKILLARLKSCAKYQNSNFYSEYDTLIVLLQNMIDDESFPFLGVF